MWVAIETFDQCKSKDVNLMEVVQCRRKLLHSSGLWIELNCSLNKRGNDH